MNKLLQKAITLATQAHHGQVDKAGKPYIQHPLWVMEQMDTPEAKIVAVLHDTVEDTPITLQRLAKEGFPPEILTAIDAITKREGEEYQDYLQRVQKNPLALKVKIADMQHNMDLQRIPNPTEKDYQRLAKYEKILPQLQRVNPEYGD